MTVEDYFTVPDLTYTDPISDTYTDTSDSFWDSSDTPYTMPDVITNYQGFEAPDMSNYQELVNSDDYLSQIGEHGRDLYTAALDDNTGIPPSNALAFPASLSITSGVGLYVDPGSVSGATFGDAGISNQGLYVDPGSVSAVPASQKTNTAADPWSNATPKQIEARDKYYDDRNVSHLKELDPAQTAFVQSVVSNQINIERADSSGIGEFAKNWGGIIGAALGAGVGIYALIEQQKSAKELLDNNNYWKGLEVDLKNREMALQDWIARSNARIAAQNASSNMIEAQAQQTNASTNQQTANNTQTNNSASVAFKF